MPSTGYTLTMLRSQTLSPPKGQWTVNQLCTLIGSPFSTDKKQPMQNTGTFLGLTHDLVNINRTGFVKFWAGARLHDKGKDIISNARASGKFTRGTASKLYGIATFWNKASTAEWAMVV